MRRPSGDSSTLPTERKRERSLLEKPCAAPEGANIARANAQQRQKLARSRTDCKCRRMKFSSDSRQTQNWRGHRRPRCAPRSTCFPRSTMSSASQRTTKMPLLQLRLQVQSVQEKWLPVDIQQVAAYAPVVYLKEKTWGLHAEKFCKARLI